MILLGIELATFRLVAQSQPTASMHVPPLPLPYPKYSYILFVILAALNVIFIILETFLSFSHDTLD
jgi:hypothetical protein